MAQRLFSLAALFLQVKSHIEGSNVLTSCWVAGLILRRFPGRGQFARVTLMGFEKMAGFTVIGKGITTHFLMTK